jgi:hypothetical protein
MTDVNHNTGPSSLMAPDLGFFSLCQDIGQNNIANLQQSTICGHKNKRNEHHC